MTLKKTIFKLQNAIETFFERLPDFFLIIMGDTCKIWKNDGRLCCFCSERTKQMEQILNFQVPAEGLELVLLLHTQY